ncbi:hypothetical protein CC78DRAFT_590320 [Lojkania enalia]|uniref:Serine hydrolase domain-containing protein n=1 Tax=Lojkania enalia TaxID=147567 RepID=A0A9P4N698_9PLEO|nr:hypothetical protein CC78DRAFT_590320 [Didymosphaeria enalia]
MLRNVKPKAKKPVVVCLHGSGSSAAILGIQTHILSKSLSKTYDLIFLDGITPSAPGPGVLPLFADMPGYYRWLAPELSSSLRMVELLGVAKYINEQLEAQNVKAEEVVAFLGFSQGAMVSLAMLGLRLIGHSSLPNLQFCVAIGAGTTGNVKQMDGIERIISGLSKALGRTDGKFPGYTVQACGLRDVWYKDGRRLQNMCAKDKTKAMDYRDGHVVPRQRVDVGKLVKLIEGIDEASKADPPRPIEEVSVMTPGLQIGEEDAESLEFLMERIKLQA